MIVVRKQKSCVKYPGSRSLLCLVVDRDVLVGITAHVVFVVLQQDSIQRSECHSTKMMWAAGR